MKVIDLLNKIANGEIPNRILYNHYIWSWTGDDYKTEIDSKEQFLITGMYYTWFTEFINDEVEIIEEEKKIPEKINNGYTKQSIVDMKEARFNSNDMAKICNTIGWLMENRNELSNKIDEIIDYLKSKGE